MKKTSNNSALFVIPTDMIGGAERVLNNIARSITHDVDEVIIYIMSRGKSGGWADLEKEKKIKIIYKDYKSEKTSLHSFFLFLWQYKHYNFKYVFTSHTHTNALVGLCRKTRLLKCQHMIGRESTVITDRFTGIKKHIFNLLYRLGYGNHDLLICQTGYMYEQLIKNRGQIARKIITINNPINIELLDTKLSSSKPNINKINILYVGRLIAIKNIHLLVNAFYQICREFENLNLILVGDGNQKEELIKITAEKGLTDKVSFIGKVDNPYQYMKDADIGIISSFKEGFPNVLLEMMYSGTRAVITTPCAGDLDKLPEVDVLKDHNVSTLTASIKEKLDNNTDNRDIYKNYIAKHRSVKNFWQTIKTELARPKALILASYANSLTTFRGDLIKALLKEGYEVHTAAPDIDASLRQELEQWGCTVHEVPLQRTGLNPVSDLKSLWHLTRLMQGIKPTLFMGYTIKPVIYGNLAAAFAKVPKRCALITGLGFAFTSKVTGIKRLVVATARKLYKTALSRSTHVLFQNPDDRQLFSELGLVDIKKCGLVNGSGVDLQHYQAAPLPSNPVFLFIGRLLADKGIREFANAARMVKASNPQARFLVAGWIDSNPTAIDQQELDEWVNTGTIEFLGKLSDVRPAILESSVYVLPSYREGTPRTVLEAMAMGRPVITTDAPGCRETVIDGRNGYLVPVKAVDQLAKAMIRFIDNPALRTTMGQESRVIVEDKYDVHKVNRSIMKQLGIEPAVSPSHSFSPQRHRGHREKTF